MVDVELGLEDGMMELVKGKLIKTNNKAIPGNLYICVRSTVSREGKEYHYIYAERLEKILVSLLTSFEVSNIKMVIYTHKPVLHHIIPAFKLCAKLDKLEAKINLHYPRDRPENQNLSLLGDNLPDRNEERLQLNRIMLLHLTTIKTEIYLDISTIELFHDHYFISELLESGHVRCLRYHLPLVSRDNPHIVRKQKDYTYNLEYPKILPHCTVKNWTLLDFCKILSGANTKYLRELSICVVGGTEIEPLWDLCQKIPTLLRMKIEWVAATRDLDNSPFYSHISLCIPDLSAEEKIIYQRIKKETKGRRENRKYWSPWSHDYFRLRDRQFVHAFLSCQITHDSMFSLLPPELTALILSMAIEPLGVKELP